MALRSETAASEASSSISTSDTTSVAAYQRQLAWLRTDGLLRARRREPPGGPREGVHQNLWPADVEAVLHPVQPRLLQHVRDRRLVLLVAVEQQEAAPARPGQLAAEHAVLAGQGIELVDV